MTVAESVGVAPSPCRTCARDLDRRAFLSAAAMAAVLAALDGCSGLTSPGGDFSGAYGGPFTVTLASFSALGFTDDEAKRRDARKQANRQ